MTQIIKTLIKVKEHFYFNFNFIGNEIFLKFKFLKLTNPNYLLFSNFT